jgi:hypothetical protein
VYAIGRELFLARATGRSIESAMATLSYSSERLMSRTAILLRIVTGFDEAIAGSECGSLGELGLRAQSLALLLLIDQLCNVMRGNASTYQELFVGRLQTIEDLVGFVFDEIRRIDQLWLRYRVTPIRSAAAGPPEIVEFSRPFLYRSAIRTAQRAMSAIGEDPDLAHFLRAGSSRTDARRIRYVCDQFADVLRIKMRREPDPALCFGARALDAEELCDVTDDDNTRPLPRRKQ